MKGRKGRMTDRECAKGKELEIGEKYEEEKSTRGREKQRRADSPVKGE